MSQSGRCREAKIESCFERSAPVLRMGRWPKESRTLVVGALDRQGLCSPNVKATVPIVTGEIRKFGQVAAERAKPTCTYPS